MIYVKWKKRNKYIEYAKWENLNFCAINKTMKWKTKKSWRRIIRSILFLLNISIMSEWICKQNLNFCKLCNKTSGVAKLVREIE
jgi:hypothetical protein